MYESGFFSRRVAIKWLLSSVAALTTVPSGEQYDRLHSSSPNCDR